MLGLLPSGGVQWENLCDEPGYRSDKICNVIKRERDSLIVLEALSAYGAL